MLCRRSKKCKLHLLHLFYPLIKNENKKLFRQTLFKTTSAKYQKNCFTSCFRRSWSYAKRNLIKWGQRSTGGEPRATPRCSPSKRSAFVSCLAPETGDRTGSPLAWKEGHDRHHGAIMSRDPILLLLGRQVAPSPTTCGFTLTAGWSISRSWPGICCLCTTAACMPRPLNQWLAVY
jgi:hypothetical protein